MSKYKFRKVRNLVLSVLLIIIVFPSCKEDEIDTPDYVGTWVAIQPLEGYGVFTHYKDILTITEDEYTDLGQMYNSSTNEWIDYQMIKASFTISEDLVNSSVIAIGITSFDSSNTPTGEITVFTEGDENFEELMEQMGQPKNSVSRFNVFSNELVVNSDFNSDGDYLDLRETIIFTKK